jgi:hypothetical protein
MGNFILIAAIVVGFILPGCAERPSPVRKAILGGAEVRTEPALPRPQVSLPAVVYVADFGLDAQSPEAGSGAWNAPVCWVSPDSPTTRPSRRRRS